MSSITSLLLSANFRSGESKLASPRQYRLVKNLNKSPSHTESSGDSAGRERQSVRRDTNKSRFGWYWIFNTARTYAISRDRSAEAFGCSLRRSSANPGGGSGWDLSTMTPG